MTAGPATDKATSATMMVTPATVAAITNSSVHNHRHPMQARTAAHTATTVSMIATPATMTAAQATTTDATATIKATTATDDGP